jgi:DNA-binding LytR/AlgR family response regulator
MSDDTFADKRALIARLRLLSAESGLWTLYVGITATIGALSVSADRTRIGAPIPAWEPFVWEYSSGTLLLLLIPGVAALERRFPIAAGTWARHVALHVAATVPFSALHVAGMVALRHAAYAVAGRTYDFGDIPSEFFYEWRKDALSYFFIIGVLNAYRWFRAKRAGEAVMEAPPAAPIRFEVRRNGRRFVVAATEIDWIEAAGNYVVLHTQSASHMMRGTLKDILAALDTNVFVRIHRSAAVNVDRLVEIDARARVVRMVSGATAPVSRSSWGALAERFAVRIHSPARP